MGNIGGFLCLYGIGIDAEEDILEHVGFADIKGGELIHVVEEFIAFLVGIVMTITLLSVAQVVGYIVVGRKLVGCVNALVEQMSYCAVILIIGAGVELYEVVDGDLLTEVDIDTSLRLCYASEYAVKVFAGFLHVAAETGSIEFERL